jgi:hypothetical protein
MPWTAPNDADWQTGDIPTETQIKQQLLDNLRYVKDAVTSVFAEVTTAQGTSSETYTALTTAGPSITLPVAGNYLVEVGARIYGSGTGHWGWMSYDIGGTAAVDADGAAVQDSMVPGTSVTRSRVKTGLGAVTLTAKYKAGNAAWTLTFADRWIRATLIP